MRLRRNVVKQAVQILPTQQQFRIALRLRLAGNKTGKSSKIDLPRFYFRPLLNLQILIKPVNLAGSCLPFLHHISITQYQLVAVQRFYLHRFQCALLPFQIQLKPPRARNPFTEPCCQVGGKAGSTSTSPA
ncbi:MAG: hypothetical protein UZ12_BCD005000614 [Bacteroidetes bacterium OLB12]|nr:MAG: hypothetical protein UZ12_BCD005000614 [Bacteroidetes bacterium OLB12]